MCACWSPGEVLVGNCPSAWGRVDEQTDCTSEAFKAHKAAELQSLKPLLQFLLWHWLASQRTNTPDPHHQHHLHHHHNIWFWWVWKTVAAPPSAAASPPNYKHNKQEKKKKPAETCSCVLTCVWLTSGAAQTHITGSWVVQVVPPCPR